ncbi:MAG: GntR family transcriptional regulator [Bacteroidales bacterium]|nr:GntR family transcriptional regulator [Bacteroidales bacterium]
MSVPFTIEEKGKGEPRFKLLADAVEAAVADGRLRKGHSLPSVTEVCMQLEVSRDTVFKAYSVLRDKGLVVSERGKGYYVADHSVRVFIFLDTFKAYKEVLYGSLFRTMPSNVIADVNFHHYNPGLFRKLIDEAAGRYSKYIVMPFEHETVRKALRSLPPSKLLTIDWNLYTDESSNAVYQDFGMSLERGLEQVRDRIVRYKEFHMLYPTFTYHPHESVEYFEKFCRERGIVHRVETDPEELDVRAGVAYLSVSDRMMAKVLTQAKDRGLALGKDVGLISYNETPFKQFIDKGITVFSTNFEQMGRMAAQFVEQDAPLRLCVPSNIIVRKSL